MIFGRDFSKVTKEQINITMYVSKTRKRLTNYNKFLKVLFIKVYVVACVKVLSLNFENFYVLLILNFAL